MSISVGRRGDVRVSAPFGLPQEEIERFVNEKSDWIAKARSRVLERLEKRNDFFGQLPLSTKEDCKAATDRLNALIMPLLEKYTKLMGVRPNGIEYKATTSRWGCCLPKTKRLQFSAYLLLLPEWCVEHVVVHELAHLIVPNHSPKFHAVMDKYFPRWREARKETARVSRMETPYL